MFRSSNPERTYIALLHEVSNCYASWDPSRLVRVGDYGHLQDDHSFAPEGNIFDNGLAEEFGITRIPGPTDDVRWIVSKHTDEVRDIIEGGVGASFAHEVKIKNTFQISRSYGAILCMDNPRQTSLAPAGKLRDLVYSTAFSKRHILVSEVYSCRSYGRLLAPKQKRTIQIALEAGAHQRLLHSQNSTGWTHTAEGGDFKFASSTGYDGRDFQPLLRLVGRRQRVSRLPITMLSPPLWKRVVQARRNGGAISDDDSESDTSAEGRSKDNDALPESRTMVP